MDGRRRPACLPPWRKEEGATWFETILLGSQWWEEGGRKPCHSRLPAVEEGKPGGRDRRRRKKGLSYVYHHYHYLPAGRRRKSGGRWRHGWWA